MAALGTTVISPFNMRMERLARSAFEAIWSGLKAPSVLLNGTGDLSLANNVTQVPYDSEVPKRYTLKVDPPTRRGVKRYLLRLINTSFESTFVFSIDNHYLQIVSADFVPIHPYWNTSVLVGIGQRYNVIVEATHPLADVDDYWISVQRASCFNLPKLPPGKDYLALGALRYGDSTDNPLTSVWPDIDLRCSDEEFSSLRPILPWKVGPAANNKTHSTGDQNVVEISNGLQSEIFPLARFSLGTEKFLPFQIDYEDPTFLHLNYTGQWNPLRVMILENYTSTDWIHLHGHDFAILQQIENANFPDKLNLKLDNPPRRDVVLLPQNGYAIIAFKADNPGVWIMHCHIAFHASFGLALQIMENQQAAIGLWPSFRESEALNATRKTCETWNRWAGNCKNWWPGDGSTCGAGMNEFAPDSGI
ncbi:MAG: hypothetical protein LQ342_004242 [Letrouitia transgressa]|nr:MAG: hypothetical protein LQ342_004242 [Letrouitia transgressa]